ncbi:uncharacterized protein LOC129589545 [Paramacrobiotus metropolitanus]|uniref:uncharacterized protein LOC129589545 n=1 Tax=Paramacrobiotus metropolitanus TaxID=2943436 RepID=UPI0024461292|nr:uncharacterized protein LOC129589545 [Paramacrobiotus metropolitanus]
MLIPGSLLVVGCLIVLLKGATPGQGAKIEASDLNGRTECYTCPSNPNDMLAYENCASWTGDMDGVVCEKEEQSCYIQALSYRVKGDNDLRWRVARGCSPHPFIGAGNYDVDSSQIYSKTLYQTNQLLDYMKVVQIVCTEDLCNGLKFSSSSVPAAM